MIYLECPFSDKDECKNLGGRWDNKNKKWYVPAGIDYQPFQKWILDSQEDDVVKHTKENEIITLSPSSLDYQPNCPRCFYLDKKFNIKTKNFPPPVFNKIDSIQKNYFYNKNTKDLHKELPSGVFFQENELPSKIVSTILKDIKGRKFKLLGIPDLVIKFNNNEFGIIDFKTTKISSTKSNSYKYQLEAYAQIFENPGEINDEKTPLLSPINHLGILQFDPNKIINSAEDNCNMIINMDYSPIIERNSSQFYNKITEIIDILSQKSIPEVSDNCSDCNFYKRQLTMHLNTNV